MPGKLGPRDKRERWCSCRQPPSASGADWYYCRAMTRLPYLRHDDLDARGQEVWGGVVGSRGGELVNEEGGLIGPFNAFVHAPGLVRHLSALGCRLRFSPSVERHLSAPAVITVSCAC